MHAFCTIVAKNYLGQALTLYNSFRAHHPNSDFFLLVVDGKSHNFLSFSDSQILLLCDLEVDSEVISTMSTYYDLFEMCTAVKPIFLRTLISKGFDSVTFLDPDIQIFSNMDDLVDLTKKHKIVLTPHRLSPVNVFNKYTDETSYLKYGVFNLGFVSVHNDAMDFILWWEDRLRRSCRRYKNEAHFTDQKWIDLVPAFFNCLILRHKGYNVAPWNLSERPLSVSLEGHIMADDERLVFIHFSQMSAALSRGKYLNSWENFLDGSNEILLNSTRLARELTQLYSSELQANTKVANSSSYEHVKWPRESFHLRSFRIAMDLRSVSLRFGFVAHLLKFLRFIDPIIIKLERFDSFNGLFDGLKSDSKRIYFRVFK